jgi:hypothetical protein
MNKRHAVAQSIRNAGTAVKNKVINFGRFSSGDGKMMNVQTTYDNEARSLKNISPYGVVSCPPSGLFAQIMMNDKTNNTFLGVYNPNAPKVVPGEIVLYSTGSTTISLKPDGTISITGVKIDINGQSININGGIVNIGGDRINIG